MRREPELSKTIENIPASESMDPEEMNLVKNDIKKCEIKLTRLYSRLKSLEVVASSPIPEMHCSVIAS